MFFRKNKNSAGFTLIELSVSIALLSLFVIIAVAYNKTEDQDVAMYREQGRIVNAVYEARAMAISTYGDDSGRSLCGYGLYIPTPPQGSSSGVSSIYIFGDEPDSSGKCTYQDATSRNLYDEGEEIKTINLKDVTVTSNFKSMMFVPPDPQVYTSAVGFPLIITIHSPRVSSDLYVEINSFGQITTTQ